MLWQTLRYLRSLFAFKKYAILAALILILLVLLLIQKDDSVVECDTNIRSLYDIPPEVQEQLKKQWLSEQNQLNPQKVLPDEPPNQDANPPPVAPLECLINDDYPVQCLKTTDKDEIVYMPFSFIEKYFEVYGAMKHYDGYDRFEFSHSYGKVINELPTPYTYHGMLMSFDTYNVEVRDRVKCVSGIEGVPLSSQWGKHGYFYGIQICQYGLSHYCKNLVQKLPQETVYEDADTIQPVWKQSNKQCITQYVDDPLIRNKVVKFTTPDSIPLGSGLTLHIGNTVERVLSFDIRFVGNGSISVMVDTNDKAKQYTIHYITNNLLLDFDHRSNIFYGIGATQSWRHIARDLVTDLRKGIGLSSTKKKKVKTSITKVTCLIVRGSGFIDNITVSTSQHMSQFQAASDWIVKNQDPESGGWKNDIERVLPGYDPIPPGWLSAMGQGQALSLLSRAYYVYKNESYLKTLALGLLPFTLPSNKGGVQAMFMGKYVWYEEYPTSPSSFVLNGFIYSLIGLYDFKSLLEDQFGMGSENLPADTVTQSERLGVNLPKVYSQASKLFQDGMTSLKAMLPLYDGGTRTFYDLRHFILKIQPKIARWDYHVTHLDQLALMSSISDDPIFQQVFQRWKGYTVGKPSQHN
ncbi:unnamed protein product [Clavelina lepadiformis]|uniref:heparosan-N-sulfate-glucuronate 5-epimerase n=1 Tax=Clavelina lepadiformis TaxID=159417 RepID=A0ABP0GMB4_CLALP